jgi:hypothetical protein
MPAVVAPDRAVDDNDNVINAHPPASVAVPITGARTFVVEDLGFTG